MEQERVSVHVFHMATPVSEPRVRCPLPQPLVWTGGMREGQGLTLQQSPLAEGQLQCGRARGYSQPSCQG